MQFTHEISDDSGQITSLVSLGKGFFATASTVASNQAGNIKIWEPNNVSPIATITEDSCSIDFLLPIVQKNDVNIVYVCQNKLKCFNVKNMKPVPLFVNGEDIAITAICHNQQNTNVISLGLADGKIKDFDLSQKQKKVIR